MAYALLVLGGLQGLTSQLRSLKASTAIVAVRLVASPQ